MSRTGVNSFIRKSIQRISSSLVIRHIQGLSYAYGRVTILKNIVTQDCIPLYPYKSITKINTLLSKN